MCWRRAWPRATARGSSGRGAASRPRRARFDRRWRCSRRRGGRSSCWAGAGARPTARGRARLVEATGMPALPIESPRGLNDPWLRGGDRSRRGRPRAAARQALDFSCASASAFARTVAIVEVDVEPALRPGRSRWRSSPTRPLGRRPARGRRGRGWPALGVARGGEARAARRPPEWAEARRSARTPIHPLRVCAALPPPSTPARCSSCDGGEFGQWVQAGLEAGSG